MFLFLSKLLPLLLYPLGLACLLMIVTLVLMWKRDRWAPVPLIAALIVLLLASNGWITNDLVRSLEVQNIPKTELPQADAIVVLGGATKPPFPPRPGVDLSEEGDRVFYAAQLYRQGKAPWVILSGGRIDWHGTGTPESSDMATILKTLGVPDSAILQDPSSLNTYQNAVNVRQILNAQKLRRVLLVTSAMHMPRSLLIFQRQQIDAIPAPTDFQLTNQDLQDPDSSAETILLNLFPDTERLQKTTRALKEYLGIIIYRLRGWL
jgi:uncharacterized SAM-binding protein YcdF (DUF218 family)